MKKIASIDRMRRAAASRAVLAAIAAAVLSGAVPASAQQPGGGYNAFLDPQWVARQSAHAWADAQQRARERSAEEQRRREENAAALAYGRAIGDADEARSIARFRNQITSLMLKDLLTGQLLEADLQARFHAPLLSFPLTAGASFGVPFGSYAGEGLIEITSRARPLNPASPGIPIHENTRIQMARPSTPHIFNPLAGGTAGWRFEPAGVLQGQIDVVQTGDTPYQPPCLVGAGQVCPEPVPNTRACAFTISYRYAGPRGAFVFLAESDASPYFSLPAAIPVAQHGATRGACLTRLLTEPESYWRGKISARYRATTGGAILELADPARPLIRHTDGSVEQLGTGTTSAGFAKLTQYESSFGATANSNILDIATRHFDRTFTARIVDGNGNATRFTSVLEPLRLQFGDQTVTLDDALGRETVVEDSEGRRTRYLRDDQGDVREIRAPGPLGREELVWRLEWIEPTWDPAQVMPDVQCNTEALTGINLDGAIIVYRWPEVRPCEPLAFKTLAAMQLPDGRRYEFDYRLPDGRMSWGALTRVKGPDGAIHKFEYGDAATVAHWPAAQPLPNPRDPQSAISAYPGGATDLNKRRLVAAVIHPQGEAGPAFGRRISHDAGGWIRTQHLERDANGERVARIVREIASVGDGPMQGRPLAIETMDESGRLVEATYFGAFPSLFELPVGGLENAGYAMPQRTIDHGLPNRLFVEFESGPTFRTDGTEEGAPLDVRPTHVVHYRDGLAWVETFTYDRAAAGGRRSHSNVLVHRLQDAAGTALLETRNEYVTDAPYLARNLVKLPNDTRVLGWSRGEWKLLARTGHRYDETTPAPSNDDRLDPAWAAVKERGNATSSVVHNVGASDGVADGAPASMLTVTRFYDNGAVRETVAPGDRVSTSEGDFRACTPGEPVRQSTAWGPDPGNGAGRSRSVNRVDCYTGLVLASIDANGNASCSQYDRLGRLVETAMPGDRLSALTDGVRDPQCATTGSPDIGSAGAGPSSWIDLRDDLRGQIGRNLGGPDAAHRHIVIRTKNGAPAGTYVKTFYDGLGRAVQVCDQVDPATNDGAAEVCTFKQYDASGKVDIEYLAFRNDAPADAVTLPPSGLQHSRTDLDALDRPVRVELVNSGVAPTTMDYGNDGRAWITRVIDPNGNETLKGTNLLGQVFNVSRRSPLCAEDWCTTLTTYDSAGRVLAIRGPLNADGTGGHGARVEYDGYGRKRLLVDPSLGARRFEYDANGNLAAESDAKGQSIRYGYDGLNRVVTKTFVDPTGRDRPGERELRYEYDANGAPDAVNARGRLTRIGNDLVSRSFAYDALGRTIAETFSGAGQAYTQSYEFGYARRSAQAGEPGNLLVRENRPAGSRVDFRYDADGQLAGIANVQCPTKVSAGGRRGVIARCIESTIVSGIRRNVHNDIVEVRLGNGTVTRYDYDENRSWRLARKTVSGPGGTLLDLRFGWDDAGNLKRLDNLRPDRAALGWRYDYDSLNQLIRATAAAGQVLEFGYTGTGNLVTKDTLVRASDGWQAARATQRYGEAGAGPYAVTASGDDTFAWDSAGNLAATTAAGGLRFAWNVENMPVNAYRGERLLDEKWFVGEALWRRAERVAATDTVKVTLYPFTHVRVEDGRIRERFGDWAERDPASGSLMFFHRDHLGSSTLVTDAGGGVVYEAYQQPFGEDWLVLADAYDPLRKYADKEQEKTTGFYDYGARLYMPQTGRWASADSIHAGALADPLNRYHFVSNNPASRVDADGHVDGPADAWNDPKWLTPQERQMSLAVIRANAEREAMNDSVSGVYWRQLLARRTRADGPAPVRVAEDKRQAAIAAKKAREQREWDEFRRINGTRLKILEVAFSIETSLLPMPGSGINLGARIGAKLAPLGSKVLVAANRLVQTAPKLGETMLGTTRLGWVEARVGYNYLDAPMRVWKALGPEKFWTYVNKPFLDSIVKRGDRILFHVDPARVLADYGGTFAAREIRYLQELGFKWKQVSEGIWQMVR